MEKVISLHAQKFNHIHCMWKCHSFETGYHTCPSLRYGPSYRKKCYHYHLCKTIKDIDSNTKMKYLLISSLLLFLLLTTLCMLWIWTSCSILLFFKQSYQLTWSQRESWSLVSVDYMPYIYSIMILFICNVYKMIYM